MINGYNYAKDDNGTIYAIDNETGEALATVTLTTPIGSTVYTPKQQEAYAQKKRQEMLRKYMLSEVGHFYFIYNDDIFIEIKPSSVTKLVYLNSFLGYDENKIMKTQKTQMKFSDLPEILGVDKATASRFFNEVSPKYITKDKDGNLYSNVDLFKRGKIKASNGELKYRKIYIDAIRKLYRETPTSKQKHLGYVFRLIPFVNIEYNILCEDICENQLSNIKPLTMKDFSQIINYNAANLRRLYRELRGIIFDVGGHMERFISIVSDGLDLANAQIYINPNIIYNGSKYDEVKILGAFCKIE